MKSAHHERVDVGRGVRLPVAGAPAVGPLPTARGKPLPLRTGAEEWVPSSQRGPTRPGRAQLGTLHSAALRYCRRSHSPRALPAPTPHSPRTARVSTGARCAAEVYGWSENGRKTRSGPTTHAAMFPEPRDRLVLLLNVFSYIIFGTKYYMIMYFLY